MGPNQKSIKYELCSVAAATKIADHDRPCVKPVEFDIGASWEINGGNLIWVSSDINRGRH